MVLGWLGAASDQYASHHHPLDDILRVAGSLKVGQSMPQRLCKHYSGEGGPTTLDEPSPNWAGFPKTLHLLNYIDDEYYRRRIQTQLNRGEDRHSVARHVFHASEVNFVSAIARVRRIS